MKTKAAKMELVVGTSTDTDISTPSRVVMLCITTDGYRRRRSNVGCSGEGGRGGGGEERGEEKRGGGGFNSIQFNSIQRLYLLSIKQYINFFFNPFGTHVLIHSFGA